MTDLFKEILPAILQTKKDIFADDPACRGYNPYMVNKALANYMDVVMYANVMNMNYHLDKKLQYDYFINSIRAMKRPYAKWFKAQESDDLKTIKLFFGYSDAKAKEALKILSDDQINEIRKITTIGD